MVTDFLIRLKNASLAKNKSVSIKLDKKVLAIAESLKKLGYLSDVKSSDGVLTVSLAFKNKTPVLRNLKLVSKPGLKVYKGIDELETFKSPSFYLMSTSKGVMGSRQAVKLRIGGEVLVQIW